MTPSLANLLVMMYGDLFFSGNEEELTAAQNLIFRLLDGGLGLLKMHHRGPHQ